MAVSFIDHGAFASGTGALTVAVPTGYASGDLLLLFVESANQTISTPSGWSQVSNSPQSTGTAATAGGVRLAVFSKTASSSESSVSVADSGNHTTAIMACFRGAAIDATSGSVDASATSTITCPAVTTNYTNDMIVCVVGLDKDAADTDTITGTWTNANLTSLAEQHDQTISGGVGGGIAFATGFKSSTGSTGTTTNTADSSTTHAYITLALYPYSVGAVTSPPLLSTASANVPSVSATADASVTVPQFLATAAFSAPTSVVGASSVNGSVTAPQLASSASMPSPTVAGVQNASVTSPQFLASASFPVPSVSGVRNASLSSPQLLSSASMPTPSVAGTSNASVTAPALLASAALLPPTVSGTTGSASANVQAVPMTATAVLTPPSTVDGSRNVSVTVPSLDATASMPSPQADGIQNVSIAIPALLAIASFNTPQVSASDTVDGDVQCPALLASATLHAPLVEVWLPQEARRNRLGLIHILGRMELPHAVHRPSQTHKVYRHRETVSLDKARFVLRRT